MYLMGKNKEKVVGVRLSPQYQEKLQKISKISELSQSSLIRVALRRFFKEIEDSGEFVHKISEK